MSDACCEDSAQSARALPRGIAACSGRFWRSISGSSPSRSWPELRAGSSALLGDSLDMLGDALVYGASLYVVAAVHERRRVSPWARGC